MFNYPTFISNSTVLTEGLICNEANWLGDGSSTLTGVTTETDYYNGYYLDADFYNF